MCKVELNVHHASLKRNKNKNLFSENQKRDLVCCQWMVNMAAAECARCLPVAVKKWKILFGVNTLTCGRSIGRAMHLAVISPLLPLPLHSRTR